MKPPLEWLLVGLCGIAGLWDWRWRRIPNWLTVPAAIVGFALQWWLNGTAGLLTGAKGFGLALLISMPLFLLNALGGGDVKLMAASGVLLGPEKFGVLFVINAVAGGIVAIVYALAKGRLLSTFRNVGVILGSFRKGQAPSDRRPDLDIVHPKALTIPRGTIYAACALILWAFGQFRA
jgi:prepilin peptidase CpaA